MILQVMSRKNRKTLIFSKKKSKRNGEGQLIKMEVGLTGKLKFRITPNSTKVKKKIKITSKALKLQEIKNPRMKKKYKNNQNRKVLLQLRDLTF